MRSYTEKNRILIIDGDETNRLELFEALNEDYDVILASSGYEGLHIWRNNYWNISVILVDIKIKDCDCISFLKSSSGENNKLCPVIVMMDSFSPEMGEECLKYGATDFFMRPMHLGIVKKRIKGLLLDQETAAFISEVGIDELTGMYSKQAFFYHAKEFLAEHSDQKFDLTILDVENLRIINSIYGESGGDELLRHVGKCIKSIPGEDVLCARYDGDKFVAFTSSTYEGKKERLLDAMRHICDTAPIPNLSVSCGVYQDVDFSLSISHMCDRALFALKSAKHNYDTPIVIYDDTLSEIHKRTQMFEARFDDALKNEEFVVWFQPKFDAKTEKLEGFEALVRWIDNDGNIIPPGDFIPVFEKDGQISKLDEYVFRKTCQITRMRMDQNKSIHPVSVNLSRASLYTQNVVERYAKIAEEIGVPLELVPIELTESATVMSVSIKERTDELKSSGFHIYMDDFGAGVSSLASFIGLPFDTVKLDKTLIDYVGDPNGNEMIRHTIEMAHFKNMKVVAEGVETWEQLSFLKSVSCDLIQGYYYSPPKPYEEIEKMIDIWENQEKSDDTDKKGALETEKERQLLEIVERLSVIKSLSKFFYSVYYLDLRDNSFFELNGWTGAREIVNTRDNAQNQFDVMVKYMICDPYKQKMKAFTDLNTIQERLCNKDIVSCEFEGQTMGWSQANFIVDDRDENGNAVHVFYATRSIREEKEAEIAQKKAQYERMEQTLEIIECLSKLFYSIYQIDLVRDEFLVVSSTPEIAKAVESVDSASAALIAATQMCVKPEYSRDVVAFLNLDTVAERLHDVQSIETTFEGRTVGWTKCILNVAERDDYGNVTKVLMVLENIEQQKMQEKLYYNQRFVFEALHREYGDVYLVDLDKNLSYLYKKDGETKDNPTDYVVNFEETGQYFINSVVLPEYREKVRSLFSIRCIRENISKTGVYDVVYETDDNNQVHFVQAVFVWPYFFNKEMDENMVFMGYKEIDSLIVEERRRTEELRIARDKAEHDPLTGLLNKGAFERLQEIYHKRPDSAIIIIDIDYFKNVNDSYGHIVGDEVIKKFARILEHNFRTEDFVTRIGGDEFAIILPNLGEDGENVIRTRIADVFEDLKKDDGKLPIVTASVGVALSDESTLNDPQEMFRHADIALYRVKGNGRNGIAFYDEK